MKIMNGPKMAEGLGAINITNAPLLGGIEIACVVLYLIPKTSNISFFLLCSYLGGAIAAAIAQGTWWGAQTRNLFPLGGGTNIDC